MAFLQPLDIVDRGVGSGFDATVLERCDPGDEAALEGLRVERGENIAQMIMRGRAVAIGRAVTRTNSARRDGRNS